MKMDTVVTFTNEEFQHTKNNILMLMKMLILGLG